MTDSLRNLKLRIKSIENTRKITRAMEMVSASKLTRTRSALFMERPYFSKLETMMTRVASSAGRRGGFFDNKKMSGKVALGLVTSDAGLCSVYNYAVIRLAEDFIKMRGPDNVSLIAIGREGFNYFAKHGMRAIASHVELYGRYSNRTALDLYKEITDLFTANKVDEAYIAYTHFTSTLRLKPTLVKLLNIECEKGNDEGYILEPDTDKFLEKIVPAYLFEKIRLLLLDAFTSEHASRMIAMKMATDNAHELIDSLTLLRNKARQAAITKDILEVVMSAEALKGQ
jgi:F-type H+-transporting ATPase subunit gamma